MIILGHDFRRGRGIPSATLADVQPQSPRTRTPIGRTPWRVVEGEKGSAVLKDRDGNTLCTVVSVEIANRMARSENSFAPLHADWVFATDTLRSVQAELHTGTPEQANKRARDLIDGVLTPTTHASAQGERK